MLNLNNRPFTVQMECFTCFMKQVGIALDGQTDDPMLKHNISTEVARLASEAEITKSPAHATSRMHAKIRQMLGHDPYKDRKSLTTRQALRLYPSIKEIVATSPQPVLTAARLAIAGNAIDYGIYDQINIEAVLEQAISRPLDIEDSSALLAELTQHTRVLYLLDNAGEAVFDRALIAVLTSMGKQVIAVAKGGPVINDCTLEDAREAGLHEHARLIENGSDAVGTMLEQTSPEFNKLFHDPDVLVISKGQANFETLMNEDRQIFFLLMSKCDVLSEFLAVELGTTILSTVQNTRKVEHASK